MTSRWDSEEIKSRHVAGVSDALKEDETERYDEHWPGK